jgi:hypothetical protein
LCEAAESAGIDVVIGIAERDAITKGSVYCTLLFIGKGGIILGGTARSSRPSTSGRYGPTASHGTQGLRSSLWTDRRSQLPGAQCDAAGHALAAQGTHVHVAAWPGREPAAALAAAPLWPRQLLLSRALASQAACYVIAVGGMRSQAGYAGARPLLVDRRT